MSSWRRALVSKGSVYWAILAAVILVGTHLAADAIALGEERETDVPAIADVEQLLRARLESLRDIRAIVSLKEYNPGNGNVVNEAEVELLAVLPSVLRVNVRKPDLFRGDAFVVDQGANEGYTYSAVHELAQCQRLDMFFGNLHLPVLPSLDDLFVIPNGDMWTDIKVVGWDEPGGREVLVLQVRPSEQAEQVLEDGLPEIEESLRDVGLSVDMDLDDVLYVWVDMELAMIRQMHVVNADGALLVSVNASDIRMDQGLTATSLKTFRGAELRRCR